MANLSSFYETKKLYSEYIGYQRPLNFDEWAALPHQKKAAVLFVQFYQQIVMAWDKANAFDFIPGEDGVSIVGQYLEKNVAKIEDNPSRFTPGYIYRVAYNCMYCICHDLKSVQDRWDNEMSNIVPSGEDQVDLFDTVCDDSGSAEEVCNQESLRKEFWKVVSENGLEAEKVANYLLSGNPSDLRKVPKSSKKYQNDPLRDIEVTLAEADKIIDQLRNDLDEVKRKYTSSNKSSRVSTGVFWYNIDTDSLVGSNSFNEADLKQLNRGQNSFLGCCSYVESLEKYIVTCTNELFANLDFRNSVTSFFNLDDSVEYDFRVVGQA